MPDISGSIRTILAADSTVTDEVSTRIRSDVLMESDTLPAIRYTVIDTLAYECLDAIAPTARARLQIDCYAVTRPASVALCEIVRIALEKKHQGDNSGQYIHEISLQEGERHWVVRPESGTDQRWFVTTLEFYVFYTTTTS